MENSFREEEQAIFEFKQFLLNIRKCLSNDAKIVIILGNPIDRAYSNYMHGEMFGRIVALKKL